MIANSIARHNGLLILLLAGATVPLPMRALAAEEAVTLEEVVVTAQKREESLQDVPLSVEAVSGAKLAEAGILRMDDLKAYVPNLQVTETGIANNIYIRGIGSGLNQGFEQSVSTYADGIYRGRGHQSRMPFLDLARVEVLRGPQPTLFGKNAVAGAVNLVSAQPTKEFEGHVRGWYDTELHEQIGEAVVSGPLSDTFGARAAVRYRQSDGYENNLTLGRKEPRRDELGGRLTLAWKPNDKLSTSLRVEGGGFNVKGRQVEIFGETPATAGPALGLTYSQVISGAALPLLLYPTGLPQGTSASAANNVVDYNRSSNGDSSDLSTFETALTVNYALRNDVTLTSITGYSGYALTELCDCDFVGATVFDAGVNEYYTQTSQEFRLTSPLEQRVSWIAGLFYQRYGLREGDYLHVPTDSLVMPVLARSFAANPALGGTPTSRAGLAAFFSDAANPRVFTQDSRQWSVFAQGTFNVTDAFRITAGGRWSKEDKNGTRVTTLTTGLGGPPITNPLAIALFGQVLGIVPHNLAGSLSENTFSPLLNVQFNFSDASMVYASAARGAKAGGFDARSNKPPVAGGTPLTSGTFQYGAEQATTYELGVKSRIGDVAEVNADIYYTDYKDLQTSSFDGAIGFNVGNGSAKVKGLELEGRWQLTPRLRLSGSLATLNFEWTSYFGQCPYGRAALTTGPNAGNCDHSGEDNQLAPKLTGVLSADYVWPLGASMQMHANVDAIYSDDYLLSLTLDPAAVQKAYTKINARLSLSGPSDEWQLALVGRNLSNQTVLSYAGDTPLANRLFSARSYYGFVDPPRSIAVEATYRF